MESSTTTHMSSLPELRPGDVFCTENPMWLGRTINAVQKFRAKDNESVYSHAGIILTPRGVTFEARWTNCRGTLSDHSGKRILIGRHKGMDAAKFLMGWDGIRHHEGQWYAGHRLLFFLLCPPLAKYISLGLGVCSEITMKLLYNAGLSKTWRGWVPDDVADMIRNWREWEIVYEGPGCWLSPGVQP